MRGIDHLDWWKKPLAEGKNPCFGCNHIDCRNCSFYTEHLKRSKKEYRIHKPVIEIRKKNKHIFQTIKNLDGNIIFKCTRCDLSTDCIGDSLPECEGDGYR